MPDILASAPPLVSIVMPAYNHDRFVGYAIESVLAQTIADWELIIIDDGSSDDTLTVVRRYRDPRIRVIVHAENMGPGAGVNSGLTAARGTWISLLASDDGYAPTRLEEQLDYLQKHPACGMVLTEFAFIGEHNSPLEDKRHFATGFFDYTDRTPAEWLRYFFDVGNCIPASSVMFARRYVDAVGLMDRRFLQLQDYDYWLRLVLAGCVLGTLHKPLTLYRIMSAKRNLSACSLEVYRRCLFERAHVLHRFLTLHDPALFYAAFPDSEPLALHRPSPSQLPAWFAHQLAERAWKRGGRAPRQFALETWFTLFSNTDTIAQLTNWGLSLRQFQMRTTASPVSCNTLYNLFYMFYLFLMNIMPERLYRWLERAIREHIHK